MNKVIALAERRPWLVVFSLVMLPILIGVASLAWLVRHESHQNQQQIQIVKEQNLAIENAFVTGCRLAVKNARDADLAMLQFLEDQLQAAGRTGGLATIRALEEIITNKENPDATCVRPPTKETP